MPATHSHIRAVDAENLYLASLGRVTILSAADQHELALRVQRDGDRVALKKLLESNLRLAARLAWQHRRGDIDLMDLIAEANLGLVLAVDHFDTARRIPFPLYARYWMRARILAWLHAHRQIVSLGSRAARRLMWGLERARRELTRKNMAVDAESIAAHLDLRVEDVRELMPLLDQRATSLDAPAAHELGGVSIVEQTADEREVGPEQHAATRELGRIRDHVLDAFRARLAERDRVVWDLRLRTDSPEPLDAIGERFGISKERVRQLELRLKQRLRDFIAAELPADALAVVVSSFATASRSEAAHAN
jgi:RNA polymerase sigma-32 factor